MSGSAIITAIGAAAALGTGIVADAALHDYSHSKLEKRLEGDRRLARIQARLKHFDRLTLSMALFNVLAAVVLLLALSLIWGEATDTVSARLAFVAVSFLILGLVFYGIVRGVAQRLAEGALIRLIGFIIVVNVLMTPIASPIRAVCDMLARMFGAQKENDEAETAVEEILDAVAEGEAGGVLQKEAADLIENIIDLNDLVANQVMTPRTSMICVRKGAPLAEIVELFAKGRHYQLPVYEENRDNIIGMIAMVDVLGDYDRLKRGERTIESLMQAPYFVPETKRVSDLLSEMKRDGQRIAVVLDEFGGTLGLVTIEDIVEEIVGEIGGAYSKHIHRLDDRQVEIDAKMPIDFLNERFHLEIPEDGDYETVGGFLAAALGKVPAKGENYAFHDVKFEVTDADERKVKRVRVTTSVAGVE